MATSMMLFGNVKFNFILVFRAVSVMRYYRPDVDHTIAPKGKNLGHELVIEMQEKKLNRVSYIGPGPTHLQIPERF